MYVDMLLESRIEDIFKKHDSISDGVKQQYLSKIPEGNSRQLDWVLTRHSKGELNGIDITPHLLAFNRNLGNMPKKQIEQYKSFDEFKKATEPYIGKNLSDKDIAKHYSHIVYHSPTMTITHHLNHISAVKAATLAKNNPNYSEVEQEGKAAWCVSVDGNTGEKHFNHYTGDGLHKFYSITINKDGQQRKYGLVTNNEIPLEQTELRDELDQHEHKDPVKGFIQDYPEILHTPLKSFFDGSDKKKYLSKIEAIKKGMIGKDEVDQMMKYPKSKLAHELISTNNPHVTEEHLLNGIDDNDYESSKVVFGHDKVTPRVIDKGLDAYSYEVRNMAIRHPKANYIHMVKASKDMAKGVRDAVFEKHPELANYSDDVDELIKQKHYHGLNEKLKTQDFTDDQYRKIFKLGNVNLINETYYKKLPNDLIDNILDGDNSYARSLLIDRNNLSDEQYKKIIPHLDSWDISKIVNKSELSEGVTDALLDTKLDRNSKRYIFSTHPISDRHFNKAIEDGDIDSLHEYPSNPNIPSKHINTILDKVDVKSNDGVHLTFNGHHAALALQGDNVTKENLLKATKNKNYIVRMYSLRHHLTDSDMVKSLINDENDAVREEALSHVKLDKETMKKIYKNGDEDTKSMVLDNPNWTDKELEDIYNNTDSKLIKTKLKLKLGK